jgi:Rho GTPase-activating protein 1
MPIEDLMIPPSAYLCDRRISPDIYAPYASGRRAFAVKDPLPLSSNGGHRLPRVLREATSFILMDENIKTEGLFRISPAAITVEVLREAFDRGQKYIMWHEKDEAVIFYRSERGQVLGDCMSQTEGYGVHAAAGLIKLWYRELRQPIIPKTSYRQLNDLFGDTDKVIDRRRLIELVSINSQWSLLTETSRLVLTKHLLPLLSRVAIFQTWNLMTPHNLATCVAPSLLCGPDPIEDARMSSIVARLLEAAIVLWHDTLAPVCHLDPSTFEESLRVPATAEDYEDPLEDDPAPPSRSHNSDTEALHVQKHGITLLDNDSSDTEDARPPLPPRPRLPVAATAADQVGTPGSPTGVVRRKPAPAQEMPPRYSTIMADGSQRPTFEPSPTTSALMSGNDEPGPEARHRRDNPAQDVREEQGSRTPVPVILRKPLHRDGG